MNGKRMFLWRKIKFCFNDFESTMMKYFLLSKSHDNKILGKVSGDVRWNVLFFVLEASGEDFMFGVHTIIMLCICSGGIL